MSVVIKVEEELRVVQQLGVLIEKKGPPATQPTDDHGSCSLCVCVTAAAFGLGFPREGETAFSTWTSVGARGFVVGARQGQWSSTLDVIHPTLFMEGLRCFLLHQRAAMTRVAGPASSFENEKPRRHLQLALDPFPPLVVVSSIW